MDTIKVGDTINVGEPMNSADLSEQQSHEALTAALVAALPVEQTLEMAPQPLEPSRAGVVLGQILAFLRPGAARAADAITARA